VIKPYSIVSAPIWRARQLSCDFDRSRQAALGQFWCSITGSH